MIQRVYEQCVKAELDRVVVATDDDRIFVHVKNFGGEVIMTSDQHQSGTDRIAEAAEKLNLNSEAIVLNIQGDEPIINENDINLLISVLKKTPLTIATLVGALTEKQARDRNTVKALLDNNKIIMFTRSPIFTTQSLYVKRHIGVYGFSKAMTEKIDKNIMIETSNEIVENLEQIRWGDNGISFNYARAAGLYKGIDTQKDLDYVRTFLN